MPLTQPVKEVRNVGFEQQAEDYFDIYERCVGKCRILWGRL